VTGAIVLLVFLLSVSDKKPNIGEGVLLGLLFLLLLQSESTVWTDMIDVLKIVEAMRDSSFR
jgi:hypothetical protein